MGDAVGIPEAARLAATPWAGSQRHSSVAALDRKMAEIVEGKWREARKAVQDAARLRSRLLRDKNRKTAARSRS